MYACECVSGFDGLDCSLDVDECVSQPCQNGAVCRDMVNRYVCAALSARDVKADSGSAPSSRLYPAATTVTAARPDLRATTVRRTSRNVPQTPVSTAVGVWSR